MLPRIDVHFSPSIELYNGIVEDINSTLSFESSLSLKSIATKIGLVAAGIIIWSAIAYIVGAPVVATAIIVGTLVGASTLMGVGFDLLMKNEFLSVRMGTLLKNVSTVMRVFLTLFLLTSVGTISGGWGFGLLCVSVAYHVYKIISTDIHLSAAERYRPNRA